jgi:hypothetical protein
MRTLLVVAVAVLCGACGGNSTGGGCKVKLSGAVTADLTCIAASSPVPQGGSGVTVAAYTIDKPRKTLSLVCAAPDQPPKPGTYSGATCIGLWRQDLADGGTEAWQAGAGGQGSVTIAVTGLGSPLSTVDGGYTIIGNAQATLPAQSGGATGTVEVSATF